MEYGNKKTFAVDIELDPDPGGEWLYGKFGYWIGGIPVGDFSLGTSLRDVLFQMKHVVSDCGNRQADALCEQPPEKVFREIDQLLFGVTTDVPTTVIDAPARFNVSIPVDIFDSWKIYLIECDKKAIIIFKKDSETEIRWCDLHRGEFDEVIKQVYRELDSMYQKQSGSYRHH